MANLQGKPTIELNVTLSLNESEARALYAIVGYGEDAFLDAFYKQIGMSYLERHEAGVRSLFNSVRTLVPGILSRIDAARKAFKE